MSVKKMIANISAMLGDGWNEDSVGVIERLVIAMHNGDVSHFVIADLQTFISTEQSLTLTLDQVRGDAAVDDDDKEDGDGEWDQDNDSAEEFNETHDAESEDEDEGNENWDVEEEAAPPPPRRGPPVKIAPSNKPGPKLAVRPGQPRPGPGRPKSALKPAAGKGRPGPGSKRF